MTNEFTATWIVSSFNETMRWCADINEGNPNYTYRPHSGIIEGRNANLTNLMHYRSHTPDF